MAGPYYAQGKYWVEAIDQALGESKTKGTPQFILRISILGTVIEEEPEKYEPCSPGERSIYLYLTPKSIDYAVEDLASIGFDKPSPKYLDPRTPGFHDFRGQTFVAECHHESYEGKEQEKWSISSDRGFAVEPIAQDKLRELDAMFGAQFKAKAKQKAPAKAKPPANAEKSLTDPNLDLAAAAAAEKDEIPF